MIHNFSVDRQYTGTVPFEQQDKVTDVKSRRHRQIATRVAVVRIQKLTDWFRTVTRPDRSPTCP